MLPSRTRCQPGWTLAEIAVYLVIAGLLGVYGVPRLLSLRDRAVTVGLIEAAEVLNHSTVQYVTTGGPVSSPLDPADLFTRLQTPVDAKSRAAGFGVFDQIDYKWVLQKAAGDYSGDRLAIVMDRSGTPVWTVVGSGDGFILVEDPARPVPAEADWTTIVDAKAAVSQVGARKSKWIWDYDEKPNAARTATGIGGSRSTPDYGTLVAPELSIRGPSTITDARTPWQWTGVSSIPGNLAITVQGAATSARGASSIVSKRFTFAEGDHTEFDVVLTREGSSATARQHVVVAIESAPTVEINGPAKITSTAPATWTAASSCLSTPIVLRVGGVPEQSANGAATVSVTHSWPAGTKISGLLLYAGAMNASGLGESTRLVDIDIPATPPPPPPPGPTPDPEPDPEEPQTLLCQWTVSVANAGAGQVTALWLSVDGAIEALHDGTASHTFSRELGLGVHTIFGGASVDGKPAEVVGAGSRAAPITLRIVP